MLELGTTREPSAAVAQYCLMVYLRPLLSLNLASCQSLLLYPAPGCCFGSACWLPPPFLCLPARWLLWLRTLPKQVSSIFQTLGIHQQLESQASCFLHGHRPKNSKNHTSIQSYCCWVSLFHKRLVHSCAVNSGHSQFFGYFCVCWEARCPDMNKTKGMVIIQYVPAYDYYPGLSTYVPVALLFSLLGAGRTAGCRRGSLLPLQPDGHHLAPIRTLCMGVSSPERKDSLPQAQCSLMSLIASGESSVPCKHRAWVESCTSLYQHLLPWVYSAQVCLTLGRTKINSFLISCLLLPQTTLLWSLQIYHSWKGILWQLLIKILAAYYCSLQMMQMDHQLKGCWKAALSEV